MVALVRGDEEGADGVEGVGEVGEEGGEVDGP